ncbi:MAG: RidA family protein [Chloroflexi bacterium]|jgi:2-iminobutanoate/2-iminopropanoate deaminase|nr:MAG: RidA family protein [Chloroflexota bacterium]
MDTQVIATAKAPPAIGPYSQAKRVGDFLFTAGQVAIDPNTPGRLVPGGIKEQTEQVLKNLSAVLEAGGSQLQDVLKTTVFMADLSEFAAMNEVYAQFFKHNPPARSTVQVAALPLGARVEIEVVAIAHA